MKYYGLLIGDVSLVDEDNSVSPFVISLGRNPDYKKVAMSQSWLMLKSDFDALPEIEKLLF